MRGRPFPDPAEIEQSAEEFRSRYARNQLGALVIERIVEHDLGVEIVPVRGLCYRTKSKGWVGNSGRVICVDAHILRYQPEEYNQVLAHETAHILRHRDLIPSAPFTCLEECRHFHDTLSAELRVCVEWEAKEWMGRVLMPRVQLGSIFKTVAEDAAEEYNYIMKHYAAHEMLDTIKPELWQMFKADVSAVIAARFGVTETVAEARIRKDWLWQAVRLDADGQRIIIAGETRRGA